MIVRSHRRNLPMELLALLSGWPNPARLIAADLGIPPGRKALSEAVNELRASPYGVNIESAIIRDERCLFLAAGPSRRWAIEMAERYVEQEAAA